MKRLINPMPASLHGFTLDQCEDALRYVQAFTAARRGVTGDDQT